MHTKDTRIIDKVSPICQVTGKKMGFYIFDITYKKETVGWYLRIFLDSEDGITIDDCEKFHKAIQPKLDEIDYDFLEISSPGLDRPIKDERDAKRNIGAVVELKFYKPIDGKKIVQGVFKGFTEDGYEIEIDREIFVFSKKDVAVAKRVIDLDHVE